MMHSTTVTKNECVASLRSFFREKRLPADIVYLMGPLSRFDVSGRMHSWA